MKKLKALNLYAGIGGNRKLWQDVEVTAVELDPAIAKIYQDFFPDDTVIVGDAHQYLLDHYKEFDFIWSSPPCQSHSKMMKATRYDIRRYPDMGLYQEIIWLDKFFNGHWIVENVTPYYKPLIEPQKIGRHLIWASFKIGLHDAPKTKGFIYKGGKKGMREIADWLGFYDYDHMIYYDGNHEPSQVLRNCVHPKTGLYILIFE
jgi:DNA (cytosine-5)-methyltransferase 1